MYIMRLIRDFYPFLTLAVSPKFSRSMSFLSIFFTVTHHDVLCPPGSFSHWLGIGQGFLGLDTECVHDAECVHLWLYNGGAPGFYVCLVTVCLPVFGRNVEVLWFSFLILMYLSMYLACDQLENVWYSRDRLCKLVSKNAFKETIKYYWYQKENACFPVFWAPFPNHISFCFVSIYK